MRVKRSDVEHNKLPSSNVLLLMKSLKLYSNYVIFSPLAIGYDIILSPISDLFFKNFSVMNVYIPYLEICIFFLSESLLRL